MPVQPQAPRHTVEKNGDLVRITLPTKRRVFLILWNSLWLIWFSVIFGMVMFVVSRIYLLYQLEKTTSPDGQAQNLLIVTGLIFIPFFLVLVGFGAHGLRTFFWFIVGKEIIEANSTSLKITRQIFSKKTTGEYSAKDIKEMRVGVKHSLFDIPRGYRSFKRNNGVIDFDYGAKTYSFGLDIDEAEAKMIISQILDGLGK